MRAAVPMRRRARAGPVVSGFMARRRAAPKILTRRPVQRIKLLNFARMQEWESVYAMIDSGVAGINDFDYVRHFDFVRCPLV